MPLQPVSIFSFISLLVISTGVVAKHGCKDRCGNLSIPYPFGVGSDCFLDPSFNVSCDSSTNPPKAYLSIIQREVIEINDTYVRVKYPNLLSVCYGGIGPSDVSYNHSMSVSLSGTAYTLSEENLITAIGCDDMVLGVEESSGSSYVGGGCSAICAARNDTGGIGYCPNNYSSLSNGCCQAPISPAEELLVQFKAVAQVGEHVKFEACMDVMDLLYENEETSVLYSSPEALAASVVVIAYIITVPAPRWEFPVLPWGQNPHASSAWCPGSSCASF